MLWRDRAETPSMDEWMAELQRGYFLEAPDVQPKSFLRLTDNWIELTIRFVTPEHGIRQVKDRISREGLDAFSQAHIQVASATFEIVGLPPLRETRSARPAPD